MNTHKLLTCGGCGHVPEIISQPEFQNLKAAECVCGRRTAWHGRTDGSPDNDAEAKAVEEFNYHFGFVEQPEPRITRVEL